MNTKFYFLILLSCILTWRLHAGEVSQKDTIGKRNMVAAGLLFPLREFDETHGAGFNVTYLRSTNRFGQLGKKTLTKYSYVYGGALSHFKGRRENEDILASYKYSRFIVVQAAWGIVYNLGKQGNLLITSGPAMAFYNSIARFNVAANLEGSYYINKRLGINGGIGLLKERGTSALLTANIRGIFSF